MHLFSCLSFKIPLLLGFLVVSTISVSSVAQEDAASDVRLVIDVSGSMKRNDPDNLRQPAVELLVELLPDGGKAGSMDFW